jgi:hypothetical protein
MSYSYLSCHNLSTKTDFYSSDFVMIVPLLQRFQNLCQSQSAFIQSNYED